jgi:D-serine deaminase-like pyridoxal phosphate-dependent protein
MSVDAPLDLSRRFPGFAAVPTPAAVVDLDTLGRNIAAMPARLPAGVALTPHVKTHKSLAIARMQRAAGAAGFTVARLNEAAMLLDAGLGPVTLAQPFVAPERVAALLATAGGRLRLIADSRATVAAAARAAEIAGADGVDVFVKVDVGLHRCGVDPAGDAALDLARRLGDARRLAFAGLLAHAGHAYGAGDADGVRRVAAAERACLGDLRRRLAAAGVPVAVVSVGSTPTLLAPDGFDGLDEVRPGNYVFLDLAAVRLGLATRNDAALGVAATVISANDRFSIVNAGSKTLSSDLGAHGAAATRSYGEAWVPGRDTPIAVEKLSEEHGFLATGAAPLAVGTAVVILPNHACPVANLARRLVGLGADGTRDVLTVDAPSGG